ncbi:hypothetical protein BS78_10G164000 [Paspalum vaginatum]|nr:hypothetical protein BS78_10G164000 [Paspalum vaginatum]
MANNRANWDEATTKTFLDEFQRQGGTSVGEPTHGNPPKFLEELKSMFSAHATNDGFDTPQHTLNNPFDQSSGQSRSKRPIREETMDSPPKKKSASIEECLRDISEADQVWHILDDDGIPEGSELYLRALFLCKNAINRKQFIGMRTKEGREQWIQFNWANISILP